MHVTNRFATAISYWWSQVHIELTNNRASISNRFRDLRPQNPRTHEHTNERMHTHAPANIDESQYLLEQVTRHPRKKEVVESGNSYIETVVKLFDDKQ